MFIKVKTSDNEIKVINTRNIQFMTKCDGYVRVVFGVGVLEIITVYPITMVYSGSRPYTMIEESDKDLDKIISILSSTTYDSYSEGK